MHIGAQENPISISRSLLSQPTNLAFRISLGRYEVLVLLFVGSKTAAAEIVANGEIEVAS